MKKVFAKIYQLDMSKNEAEDLAFNGSEYQMERFGSIRTDLYRNIYEGPVEVESDASVSNVLESIYETLNIGNRPEGYSGWSLSPSDIVGYGGKQYYVEPFGFTELEKEMAS